MNVPAAIILLAYVVVAASAFGAILWSVDNLMP